jgi:predicted permease
VPWVRVPWISKAASLYRRFRNPDQTEQELDNEVQAYFEILIERHMARGLSREEAARTARIEFEGPEQVKHKVRDARTGVALETTLRDIRYAARVLRKAPGFTAVAVVTLAMGIGANTAIFSLANALLLQPLKILNPEEIVGCYSVDTHKPDASRAFSYPNYADLRDKNSVFSKLAAHNMASVGLTEGDTTRRVPADIVSSNYFDTMGVPLFKGRTFTAAEEKPGAGIPSAIVSYSYWEKHGSDPELVGKALRINGRMFTVAGITAEGFTGTMALFSSELYLPLGAYSFVADEIGGRGRSLSERDNPRLILIGRLKPGMTEQAADARLAVVASQMEKAYPAENKNQTFIVSPLSRLGVSPNPARDEGKSVPLVILAMMSMPAVVLLIASLNLANMMLARGSARGREIAIRLAIGGGRGRIVRQLCTEGFLLAIVGGAAGLSVASWGSALLIRSLVSAVPFDLVFSSKPDIRVLAATMAFCMLSTIVFGLWPAWRLSRPDVTLDLKTGGEDVGGELRRLFSRRNVLVMAQLSLSLMMLTASGLFVRSAMRAAHVEPGFSLESEVVAEVDPSLAGYGEARGRQIYAALLARLKSVPGVESVGLAWTVPFAGFTDIVGIRPAGGSPRGAGVWAEYNIVTEDYFRTLGIPLLLGRSFLPSETSNGLPRHVAVIDKLAAERLWPNGGAVGKHVLRDSEDLEVVGVVGTVQERIIGGELRPDLYVPFGPEYRADMHIHLKVAARGREAQARMLETVRSEIRQVDAGLPVLGLKTLRDHLDQSLDLWVVETGARILGTFGMIALLLAVIGLYGVRVYTVARRTREIGIRMALGASSADTQRMILREGCMVTVIGLGCGLLLALALGRVLTGFLYDVRPVDAMVLSIAMLLLTMVSMLACYLPARNAARVDPMVALRYE